jgi:hypothetical protein
MVRALQIVGYTHVVAGSPRPKTTSQVADMETLPSRLIVPANGVETLKFTLTAQGFRCQKIDLAT